MSMGNNSSGKNNSDKNNDNRSTPSQNIYNAVQPLATVTSNNNTSNVSQKEKDKKAFEEKKKEPEIPISKKSHMSMGNNSSGKNNSDKNNDNHSTPLATATSNNNTSQKEKDKKAFEEKKKEPEILIDDLCKENIDPFFDDVGIDDDPFMNEQHEIELSDIPGYIEETGYKTSTFRGSKEFICCKLYYGEKEFKKRQKNGLLIWTRAVISEEKETDKYIQINCIELLLNTTNELYFDPSNIKSYRLKSQYIIPIKHQNNNQQRLKCELHPKRPLLFIFTRQSINQGTTSLELFNFENDCKKIRYTGIYKSNKQKSNNLLEPNAIFSFGSDYYLNNEGLEQNNLHFITKKFKNIHHEYVLLFHKPEIEQNISSGSKIVVFDLTEKTMNNFKNNNNNNNNYNQYNNYHYNNYGNNRGTSINFNTSIWNLLHVGQTYHHNLIDIYPRDINDKNILIVFRIHHVNLINQDNTPAPPQALAQLDPNSNFNFESFSEIYYVNMDIEQKTFKDIKKFGFKSLQLSKTSVKESNCVDAVKFSHDGKFFAIIKQREYNDEALFRIYRTGETNKSNFLCQMTNIDIKPWMIELKSHYSNKFGYFFSISHINDDIEKAWMILAGPNIHGDLQNYREILREWLYDDAISVVMDMIGLSHRYTLHLDIGYLAGEQMAHFDYNKYLDSFFFAVDDATYLLFNNCIAVN
eukprot:125676_1